MSLKQQHLDNTFDTWTRLSDLKAHLDEIKTLLDDRKSKSNNLMTKVEQCDEQILRVQQRIEQRLETNLNHEKEQHVGNKDGSNRKLTLEPFMVIWNMYHGVTLLKTAVLGPIHTGSLWRAL